MVDYIFKVNKPKGDDISGSRQKKRFLDVKNLLLDEQGVSLSDIFGGIVSDENSTLFKKAQVLKAQGFIELARVNVINLNSW